MGKSQELSVAAVDAASLERALMDAEVANLRVMELTRELLDREERISKLESEIVALKRVMDPRRRAEHIVRNNHILYAVARRAKGMTGR